VHEVAEREHDALTDRGLRAPAREDLEQAGEHALAHVPVHALEERSEAGRSLCAHLDRFLLVREDALQRRHGIEPRPARLPGARRGAQCDDRRDAHVDARVVVIEHGHELERGEARDIRVRDPLRADAQRVRRARPHRARDLAPSEALLPRCLGAQELRQDRRSGRTPEDAEREARVERDGRIAMIQVIDEQLAGVAPLRSLELDRPDPAERHQRRAGALRVRLTLDLVHQGRHDASAHEEFRQPARPTLGVRRAHPRRVDTLPEPHQRGLVERPPRLPGLGHGGCERRSAARRRTGRGPETARRERAGRRGRVSTGNRRRTAPVDGDSIGSEERGDRGNERQAERQQGGGHARALARRVPGPRAALAWCALPARERAACDAREPATRCPHEEKCAASGARSDRVLPPAVRTVPRR
jgi:hypothetical protein